MAKVLTDLSVRHLKPGDARREVRDGGQPGLYCIVQPSGVKTFAVRYRYHGRPRKLTLQAGMSLAAARKEAAAVMYAVHEGKDPAADKVRARAEARAASADTLEAIVAEFFRRESPRLRSAPKWQRDLERAVLPVLGRRPIADIGRRDIVRLLDKIEDESGASAADIALSIVRRVMNWHAARSDDFRSPIVRGMTRCRPSDHARSRILNDNEIRAVWRAANSMQGPFGHYVKFLLLTASRRNEAAHLRWREVVGTDWTLPAARNKTKVDLARPLSAAALAVLAKVVPRIAGSDFVFSADGRRLGGMARRKREIDEASGVTGWTLHDLRRTARSLMSRSGVPSEHAERCLGHVIGGVEGVYDRHQYRSEMLIAYEKLATLIGQIVDPQPNVVALQSRSGPLYF
jgi:integrase